MFSIIEHIEYLLTRHDCVVIPEWGAFIANYSFSSYDDAHGVMGRPQRFISFNSSVSHNDGLISQSIMRREGLDYPEAMRFISDSVTAFRQQLSMGCEVSMGRIGYFKSNDGGLVEFVPFPNDYACDGFYGLSDMNIKTVSTLEQELVENEDTRTAIVPDKPNLFIRKATRIAASIAVLIGLGVLLSTPIIVDRNHDMASMTPIVTAPQSQHLDVTVQQGVVSQPIEMVEHYPGLSATGNNSGKYYMVIATLRNQKELDSFKAKYAELVPYMKLMDYKGYTCVYVARSDDYNTLMSLRGELPERLRDVWIYN